MDEFDLEEDGSEVEEEENSEIEEEEGIGGEDSGNENELGSEEDEASDSIEDEEEEDEEDDDEDDGTIQTLTKEDTQSEIEKGKAVQHQLRVWDSLLEIRIRLQQILVHSNKLPQPGEFAKLVSSAGETGIPNANNAKLAVSDLLDNLIELKETMIEHNPETNKTGQAKAPVDENEEITSSEDDDEEDTKEEKPVQGKKSKSRSPKRRKLEVYESEVQKRYESLASFRNTTIQKWNDRTQVASGKFNKKNFSAFQISTLKQIEQILSDRERLIRRTRLKRSHYEIVGKAEEPKYEDESTSKDKESDPVYDPEIFDDDDYYHQLLRELIERKTSNVTDPVQLSRHWLELQKFRSKMKRKVDTKASKARKIRYDVLPKLINFMAPVDESPMTDHAMNELFSSLFGQQK